MCQPSRFSPLLAALVLLSLPAASLARPPIRADFFATYTGAVGSKLDVLPSNSKHCGLCHFDFNGGGPRTPYGLGIEIGRNNGLTNVEAILAIANDDSDSDGFNNVTEITEVVLFTNTPTFPGYNTTNVSGVLNIPVVEIAPYLVPSGATDTTPPAVTVLFPNGGESVPPNGTTTISYTATDASGIAEVSIYLSDDGGTEFEPIALHAAPGGTFSWFVPNLPGTANRIRVVAVDNAGNPGQDVSNAAFTVSPWLGGRVPTTIRDMKIPGTQPLAGVDVEDPEGTCSTCHGDYNESTEPWANWQGSMMGQAMRDPFFLACMTVAEQDAPSVGDLCIRCHSPGGWMEGRSVDTSGGLLVGEDRQGIHCDFCHRMVDRTYVAGVSPPQDFDVLASLEEIPLQYGNGQFIADPNPLRRGPFGDAQASHDFVESPVHRSSDICGTCHDVSNPVFVQAAPGDYAPNGFDAEHPDMDVRNMFPVERTFSEWTQSAYAAGGVYAPQFAGNKPDGIVSTCQDCHMRDVAGKGCNEPGAPNRPDLPLHDFMGGNTFIPDVLPLMYPGEVDVTRLQAAKQRAVQMLQLAATLEVTPKTYGVDVRVINETAHKLPSGYPEGRRIWLHVLAEDGSGQPVFESGAYDFETGVLTHDEQIKVYEIHPGLSPGLAGALGLPPGVSFHFVLNDTVYGDNRIPPRGFANAAFASIQSPVVDYAYEDGQHWDDTAYILPASAESVTVTLYYQSTSKEYVEFLRDANVTNSAGQDLYDAWVAVGRAAPVAMVRTTAPVHVATGVESEVISPFIFGLTPAYPNPFSGRTRLSYSVPEKSPVRVRVYDISGRELRTLVDQRQDPGKYELVWDGRDARGQRLPAGMYFIRCEADQETQTQRVVLMP